MLLSGDVVVKLNMSGIREVLKSPGVQAMLAGRADRVYRAAEGGVSGHEAKRYRSGLSREVQIHRVEAVARIGTTYEGGKRVEARQGVLARAIGAAS